MSNGDAKEKRLENWQKEDEGKHSAIDKNV